MWQLWVIALFNLAVLVVLIAIMCFQIHMEHILIRKPRVREISDDIRRSTDTVAARDKALRLWGKLNYAMTESVSFTTRIIYMFGTVTVLNLVLTVLICRKTRYRLDESTEGS
jgi:hypothetical protein